MTALNLPTPANDHTPQTCAASCGPVSVVTVGNGVRVVATRPVQAVLSRSRIQH